MGRTMKVVNVAVVGMLLQFAGMTAVQAQTLSYGEAMTKLAQDCGSDVKKHCDGINLGSGRIAECLQKNSARISPTCSGSLTTVFTSVEKREQAQGAYEKVCRGDMARRCKGVKGDGYILACLNKAHSRVGKECNQTIIDAGWR
ncbi:hypothetical protein GAO09_02900 [Rhizobiales bacterium RZME27]|uniref:Cysteine rich repeat protein n=1 Tax=Endobacterium cereale TaxID=2663029 RepID=A0A6A8A1X7_9HYPH|nr:hypothetical protein [Endobacterium cereale]